MASGSESFFSGLFDFSFTRFVTTRVISVLYFIAIAIAAFLALAVIVGGFNRSFVAGIGAVIVSPLVFLIYVLFARVALETLIVAFKTAENTRQIAENTKNYNS